MADWYVSSVTYNALPTWAASTAYTVGQLIRAVTVPGSGLYQYVYRCTTAGTSGATEPGWPTGNNGTTTSGGATFTNVTAQSTYGWAAAGGNIYGVSEPAFARPVAGDRLFVASDHSETSGNGWNINNSNSVLPIPVISVNRAGSVPPVAADHQSGATWIVASGDFRFDCNNYGFIQGMTFTVTNGSFVFNYNTNKTQYFKDCTFILSSNNTTHRFANGNATRTVWDNCKLQFGSSGQAIQTGGGGWDFNWINTPIPFIGSVVPALLIYNQANLSNITFRGLDLSFLSGTTLTQYNTQNGGPMKLLLDSCKLHPSTVRYTGNTTGPAADEVELVNCHDGTNLLNERATSMGNLTTERTITLSGGASDTVGAFAHKLVSNTRASKYGDALESFYLDVQNAVTGVPKTATVEIISSGSLNNEDITLEVEYPSVSGSVGTAMVSSKPSTLTASAALPTSSATWNSSPGTPVKQYLRVTFTPLAAGRIRGRVCSRKASTTVYINPQLTLA